MELLEIKPEETRPRPHSFAWFRQIHIKHDLYFNSKPNRSDMKKAITIDSIMNILIFQKKKYVFEGKSVYTHTSAGKIVRICRLDFYYT